VDQSPLSKCSSDRIAPAAGDIDLDTLRAGLIMQRAQDLQGAWVQVAHRGEVKNEVASAGTADRSTASGRAVQSISGHTITTSRVEVCSRTTSKLSTDSPSAAVLYQ
jgi:hypothetical protein